PLAMEPDDPFARDRRHDQLAVRGLEGRADRQPGAYAVALVLEGKPERGPRAEHVTEPDRVSDAVVEMIVQLGRAAHKAVRELRPHTDGALAQPPQERRRPGRHGRGLPSQHRLARPRAGKPPPSI